MFGELVSVKTQKNIDLVGFLSTCENRNSKLFIMTHGRGGNLHSGMSSFLKPLYQAAHQSDYDFLTISDSGSGFFRIYDKFESCLDDYFTWLEFCKRRGYQEIILAAHSYGPLKITYFYHQIKPKEVKGLFYLAPTDAYGIWKKQAGNQADNFLNMAHQMIKEKNGHELMSKSAYYNPISAQSYYSLYGSKSKMKGIFDFHDPQANYKILKGIQIPVLVIIGSEDKFNFDVLPEEKIKILNQVLKKPTCVLIPDGDHVLTGKDQQLSKSVKSWLSSIK